MVWLGGMSRYIVEECCEELEEGVASFVFPARKGVTRDGEPLGY